mmetsp:Transcript_55127/g.102079  ORF Transcript_55127/g.102079 Transcript_55127/m.102079 type:complete len:369 (+) Transcript_55127:54-1160(+)
MVLTAELQGYAENIWKRFPEEFIALGSPGLEDNFILRNGHAHRITDTSAQKVIEIVLQRRARGALGNNDLEDLSDNEHGASMQHMALPCSRSKERVQNGLDHLYQAVQGLASILVECMPEDMQVRHDNSPTGRENNSPRDSLCQRRGMRPLAVNAEGKNEGARLGKVTKIPSDNEMPAPVPSRSQAQPMTDRPHGHPCHGAAAHAAQAAACPRGHGSHPHYATNGAGEESPGTRIQRWAEKKRPGSGSAPHKAPSGFVQARGGNVAAGSLHDQAMAVAMAPASDLVARNFQLGPGCSGGSVSGVDTSGIILDSDVHASLNRSNCSDQSHQTHISHSSQLQAQLQVARTARGAGGENEPGSPQKRRFRK